MPKPTVLFWSQNDSQTNLYILINVEYPNQYPLVPLMRVGLDSKVSKYTQTVNLAREESLPEIAKTSIVMHDAIVSSVTYNSLA